MLLLSEHEAHLLDDRGGRSSRPMWSGFPLNAREVLTSPSPRRLDDFLHEVDLDLGVRLRRAPAPLVLVGEDHVLAAFERISRNTGRLAGTVTLVDPQERLIDLLPRIRSTVERYLRSQQEDALRLMDSRRPRGEVVDGVRAAWSAAHAARPEMLAVEAGLVFPDRNAEGGNHQEADGSVEELMRLVHQRGGWVVVVADGLLSEHHRAVLTLRSRARSAPGAATWPMSRRAGTGTDDGPWKERTS
ncbi:hypothetical protein [Trujillonella humicola]|uniref:baeRF3 domain-containing protein n=1 Tax=Trujillonella humicola TaxID=3383699 RepID=UPI0039067BCC